MEYNNVGKIEKTHGLKGELKIRANTSYIEERFREGNSLYIKEKDNYKELIINTHRSMAEYELLSFKSFDSIDAVTPLLKKELFAIKDNSLLKDGELFYSDYIGMDVYQFNKHIGVINEIVSLPASDYFVIETLNKKEKMVPLLKEFIKSASKEENKIYLEDIEGLF